jgi:hypothetical protein
VAEADTPMMQEIKWPDGKDFAFTVFDDPDFDTVKNTTTMYSFLEDLGMRTTKAIWPIRGEHIPKVGGVTCEDERYLKLVQGLKGRGFEIGLHNATYHTSDRNQTARGLETFRQYFGHDPCAMANHTGCQDNIYWGSARVSGMHRFVYNLLNLRFKGSSNVSEGHLEGSALFWGDLCREKVKYVRNFVYGDVNTLKVCPVMPYHDSARPFVNYWFASSEGANVDSFNATVSEANQDRLADEGGACIMYTHFASRFLENGKIDGRFRKLMHRLSKMNGWFVPVSTLLDYILLMRGHHVITQNERKALESRWMWHKITHTRGRS